jgi:hypothetical protein
MNLCKLIAPLLVCLVWAGSRPISFIPWSKSEGMNQIAYQKAIESTISEFVKTITQATLPGSLHIMGMTS